MIGVLEETIELSGKVLKNTCDLAGDLLEAKTRTLQNTISQQCNSQKLVPFTSAGRPPFIGRRTDFLHTEIVLV
jgi:hypothetical protein